MTTFLTGLIIGLAIGVFLGRRLLHRAKTPTHTTPPPTDPLTDHFHQQQQQKSRALKDIMAHVQQHGSITNDQVEALTNVSDATATRYLEELRQQGQLDQQGETGRGVHYTLPK